MPITNSIFLAFALIGAAAAQIRAPIKVNICVPVGNNTHTPLTVLSTELEKYPGYVKGACSKICTTICKAFPLREVNAVGQCICKGLSLKCGANAVPSNDKKSCKCLVGYKGDPLKACVDTDECAVSKNKICPANNVCENTPGSYKCLACGANSKLVNNKCVCDAGFEGDAYKGCTDIDECLSEPYCGEAGVCVNTAGSSKCVFSTSIFIDALPESGPRFTVTSSHYHYAGQTVLGTSLYDGDLFRPQRYSSHTGGLTYSIWGFVSGAAYSVTLGFSEISACETGRRIFDVLANGELLLSSFEIYPAAGCDTGYATTHTVVANAQGEIEVKLAGEHATISFIHIMQE
jgi:Malectin domain/Calcium-binding EGF domain